MDVKMTMRNSCGNVTCRGYDEMIYDVASVEEAIEIANYHYLQCEGVEPEEDGFHFDGEGVEEAKVEVVAIYNAGPASGWDIYENGELVGFVNESDVENPKSFDPKVYPYEAIMLA